MGRITGRGIAITLYDRTQTGTDEFGAPTYAETPVIVENVLAGEPSTQDIIDEINLSGKQLAYTLAIPKGDTHVWTDRTVEFFGETFRTIGNPTQGIDELIPLDWNKKVKVERYEQSED
jgi:hypothetical protein